MGCFHAACIIIHFCAFAFAVPLLTPSSLSLLRSTNISLASPFSITPSLSTNHLPYEPFTYHVPDSDETVRFYGYGTRIPREDTIHAIVAATRVIAMHGSSDEPIPDRLLRYGAGNVYIAMHHKGRMTWRVWETALRGIVVFLEKYEYVDMEFDVGQEGMEKFFGTGAIGMMRSQE